MFRHTLTLGHIAAIPLRLHWSWPLIFCLLLITLSPIYAFYVAGIAAWALGAAMGLLVCGSVVLHELGHALVARRFAMPVRSITLFAFGGAAEVQAEAPNPGAEFAIAIAGPAVSMLLALISAGICWAILANDGSALLATFAAHLACANGMMAVFNLLPGYPMDGGRILRAVLWFLLDDPLRATRIASWFGQGCAVLIGVLGMGLSAATGQLLPAFWLGAIGFFLYHLAERSYWPLAIQTALRGVSVSDVMQRRFRTVPPDLTLEQFVGRYVLGQTELAFPVTSVVVGGTTDEPSSFLLGMMTLREIRRFTIHEWPFIHVSAAMQPLERLCTAPPHWNAHDALNLMSEARIDIVPVTDGPHVVGLLHRRDLVKYIQIKLTERRKS